MANKKELTTKQEIRKYKKAALLCKIGEYAVVPIPFFVLMIVNRDEWFATPLLGISVGLGGGLTIGLLISSILLIIKAETSDKPKDEFLILAIRWLMIAIVISLIEYVLKTIAGVMWIASTGIFTSYGLNVFRKKFIQKATYKKSVVNTATERADIERAAQELAKESEKQEPHKIKVKIKK